MAAIKTVKRAGEIMQTPVSTLKVQSEAPFTRSRFHGETAKVLYGSAFRPHEAGESADRNRKLLKPPSEVVSNLSGFVLVSCGRLKPTETANHDVIAPPLDLLANGS